MSPKVSARTVAFGPFEFDSQSGDLRKHGLRLKLQGQPVQLLAELLQRPGELVTRDELRQALWPGETYVDFEHSLNAAMKRLRAALGDSAHSPRYIETLSRRGYRFIAPAQAIAPAALAVAAPLVVAPAEPKTPRASDLLPKSESKKPGLARPRWVVAAAVLVLSAAAATTIARSGRLRRDAVPATIRSIAVLPLTNHSGGGDQEYFADAMTDAVRERLEDIASLRVISRTSSAHYRATSKTVPEIARELKVDAVVGGSVLRSGDRVRVQVELVQASSDTPLWSNSYDGDLHEVFALQASIASAIASAIRSKLTDTDRARLRRSRPSDPEAFQAYAKGRFLWNRRTPADLKTAISLFQTAVEKDPGYALAYDGLADSWLPLGWYGFVAPKEAFPNAKRAIARALALDNTLAEAHTSLAFVEVYYDRDWATAEREFQRAIQLNPNYANAHHWFAEFLSLVGRHEQAIAESQRAREIDPLSSIINTWVSSRYLYAREYGKAVAEGRNALDMDPNFAPAHLVLGQAYEQKRMLKEAAAEFERAATLGNGASMYRASLAHALGIAGRRSDASKVVDEMVEQSRSQFISSYDLALAYLGLGDRPRVLELLSKAIQEHSPRAAFMEVDPRFDQFRTDPRFRALLLQLFGA
jgi:TolB-like protein/DNA-binding winged helix-turn-helix (wHTH) protein/Flp pilus assembly protein TadD